ncbi:hypothetical protein ACIRRX_06665 [Streptomyces bacillaris]
MSDFRKDMRYALKDAWEAVWDFVVDACVWFLLFGTPIIFVAVDLVLHEDLRWTECALSLFQGKGKALTKHIF